MWAAWQAYPPRRRVLCVSCFVCFPLRPRVSIGFPTRHSLLVHAFGLSGSASLASRTSTLSQPPAATVLATGPCVDWAHIVIDTTMADSDFAVPPGARRPLVFLREGFCKTEGAAGQLGPGIIDRTQPSRQQDNSEAPLPFRKVAAFS